MIRNSTRPLSISLAISYRSLPCSRWPSSVAYDQPTRRSGPFGPSTQLVVRGYDPHAEQEAQEQEPALQQHVAADEVAGGTHRWRCRIRGSLNS